MLSEEQIRQTFEFLGLPTELAAEGSPIYIECPFRAKHTGPNKAKDTLLYFDDYPHLWCFHESCRGERRELNFALRVIVTGTGAYPEGVTFNSPSAESGRLAAKVVQDRKRILEKFTKALRPLAEIKLKPIEFLRVLFSLEDVVWIGRTCDSGKERHAKHFRTIGEWLVKPPPAYWPYTTGCTFQSGAISRCVKNVIRRMYLILESDELSAEDTRAMFAWVEETLGLKLRAIIFSGNKSLHGWFDAPDSGWLIDFEPILVAAGFCPGSMNLAQPVRLANARREETLVKQKLLWMSSM